MSLTIGKQTLKYKFNNYSGFLKTLHHHINSLSHHLRTPDITRVMSGLINKLQLIVVQHIHSLFTKQENRLVLGCDNWERYDFKGLLRLVKSYMAIKMVLLVALALVL